ncbi:MAG TPA: helix-turn-helix domain-containing protein [Novosphingobium sp.]|nr:helix-turn-helix domain-containing protein [Novosphingobium sp.]
MSKTAERLYQAMVDKGVDQSALAVAVGATQGAISKILKGHTVNSRLLPRIAIALGVQLDWLLGKDAGSEPREEGAPAREAITAQDRELLAMLNDLPPAYRAALLQLTRAVAEIASGAG